MGELHRKTTGYFVRKGLLAGEGCDISHFLYSRFAHVLLTLYLRLLTLYLRLLTCFFARFVLTFAHLFWQVHRGDGRVDFVAHRAHGG